MSNDLKIQFLNCWEVKNAFRINSYNELVNPNGMIIVVLGTSALTNSSLEKNALSQRDAEKSF